MKRIKILLTLVIVLLGGIFLTLVFWGGHVVKHGVEQVAPRVLGVPVTLEQARFQPLRGQIRLNGFVIGNPEGFRTDHLFAMQNLEIDVDVRSVFSDAIIIRRIEIESPHITYEVGLRRTNLGTLLANLESKAEAADDHGPPDAEVPARQVIIQELVLVDARLQVSATAMGGRAVPVRLSTIRLTDLGGEDQSITQISAQVLRAIMGAAGNAVVDAGDLLGDGLIAAFQGAGVLSGAVLEGARAAGGLAGDGVRAASDTAGDAARAVGGAATGGARAAAETVGGGMRSLRGLVGRSDDEADDAEDDAEPEPPPDTEKKTEPRND